MAKATDTTNPSADRFPLSVRLLHLQAEYNALWAERQVITARGLASGQAMFAAERKAIKATTKRFKANGDATDAELHKAEPRTYQDCIAKLQGVLDPHLGYEVEGAAETSVRQVLAFLIENEGRPGPRHLESIADDLAKLQKKYNRGGPGHGESKKGRKQFAEMGELEDEIIGHPATNAADAAVKAQLLRDYLEVFDYGEKQERLLKDIVTFLEHTGEVVEREKGALV